MMHLNLKQPLAVLPGHQGNVVVGARAPSLPARRVGGGSSSSSRCHGMPRISCSATEEMAGAVTAATVEKMLTVRATVEASPAIGRMYATRGLDDIGDLLGKSLLLELVSSEVDPKTGLEKERVRAFAHKTLVEGHYEAEFKVPASFGPVGVVLVENEHHKEIFIREIKLVTGGDDSTAVTFDCNSWVHSKFDNPEKRVFFILKSYLPSETPEGLSELRKKELETIRGNGHGERKSFDRVYDYDVYNDLGDPDRNPAHHRPVMGGSAEFPYPRRCRTGRPRTRSDPLTERRDGFNYVPRDEWFSEVKQLTFGATTLRSGLHALLPAIQPLLIKKELRFPHFPAIDDLYSDGIPLPAETGFDAIRSVVPRMVKLVEDTTDHVLRFEIPEMMGRDRFSWFKDEEFSRQTLAGLNPLSLQLLTEFPITSKLDPAVYGSPESAITREILEKQMKSNLTVEEALAAKRLFILDYHDVFLPYVHRVREQPDTTLYGSRTVFFLTDAGTLMPLAIELTRPLSPTKPQWKRVFTHDPDATGAWLWKLAKAHVLTHDTGYHQLVSHWLRTHCCVEPYIIAANRQLSRLHPVYRLLHPHFRYTMEINALARESLVNAGGIIEDAFWPGKYSVELSSVVYGATWQFDTEALPNDLVRRGARRAQGRRRRAGARHQGLPLRQRRAHGLGLHQAVGGGLREVLLQVRRGRRRRRRAAGVLGGGAHGGARRQEGRAVVARARRPGRPRRDAHDHHVGHVGAPLGGELRAVPLRRLLPQPADGDPEEHAGGGGAGRGDEEVPGTAGGDAAGDAPHADAGHHGDDDAGHPLLALARRGVHGRLRRAGVDGGAHGEGGVREVRREDEGDRGIHRRVQQQPGAQEPVRRRGRALRAAQAILQAGGHREGHPQQHLHLIHPQVIHLQ